MDLFSLSYLPSFPNTQFTVPATYLTGVGNLHGQGHDNFTRFLQHAQGLGVNILPLVWEPAFEVLGRDGATGRVNESQLNAQFAFAFKRFKPDVTDSSLSLSQFRDIQYSAMINEMTILSCPPIKNHDSIIVFVGVGFELFSAREEVWPMLIFSKFNQGDLGAWMLRTQNLEGDILLGICGRAAKGIGALHDCNVVHGDIKPENILINQNIQQDVVSVALADFGFSTFSKSEDGLVYLSRSEPWEAPEWHNRAFTLRSAKKMDLYSFGLLCLWIFFRMENLADLGFPLDNIDAAFSGTNREATAAIQALKQNGDAMLDWALHLLQKNVGMEAEIRSCLERIFKLTLMRDENGRDTTMEALVQVISTTQDQHDQTRTDPSIQVTVTEWHGSLSIEKLFFPLESCDYRIHTFLAKSLAQMAESVDCECCSRNAAFQLSLCHALGFGVTYKSPECAKWLDRAGKTSNELADALTRIREAEPDAMILSRLAKLGYRTDLPSRYRQDGILSPAIENYRSMILARQRSLSSSHFSTIRLKGILIKLLRWNDQQQEAVDLALEMIDREELRPVDMMELKSNISLIYHELGKNELAESIERELLETYGSDQWRSDTTRLDSQTNLVDILTSRGMYEDARAVGQKTVHECSTELGTHHASTRAARRSLAAVCDICGELAEALRITEELVQSEEQYSKLDPIYPKLVEDVSRLGIFYYRLENYNSALSCYDRVKTWIKHNAENAVYAVNSVNNQATRLIRQGALSQAKSILEALLRECTEVLGLKSEETALVMGNLAFIYHSEKEWTKAEQLGRQVIDTRREVLGPSHHKTLTAMGNLRSLLVDQQKFGEALKVAKEELACRKSAADSTDEADIDATIIISGAFESVGAFEEAIGILDEARNATESRGPLQGVLRARALEAICYLQLGQVDKARRVLFTLLGRFQLPFKEDMTIFIPELLCLAKICLRRDCTVEAKQVLIAAGILSKKSTAVSDDVRDEVNDMALKYLVVKGAENTHLSLDPSVILSQLTEEEKDGVKRADEASAP